MGYVSFREGNILNLSKWWYTYSLNYPEMAQLLNNFPSKLSKMLANDGLSQAFN